jgi:hypothetical protein
MTLEAALDADPRPAGPGLWPAALGGLQDILARLRERLAPVCEEFRTQTRRSPVQHMDETGWRQDGQNGYLWVQATQGPAATRLSTYHQSRAGQVARDLLGEFGGVLSTDFYGAYDQYAGPKQRCWAHLLRDAHKLAEAYPERGDVQEWVAALKRLVAGASALDLSGRGQRERARVARHLERRLRLLARCYRQTAVHPAQVLAIRGAPLRERALRVHPHARRSAPPTIWPSVSCAPRSSPARSAAALAAPPARPSAATSPPSATPGPPAALTPSLPASRHCRLLDLESEPLP